MLGFGMFAMRVLVAFGQMLVMFGFWERGGFCLGLFVCRWVIGLLDHFRLWLYLNTFISEMNL